MKITKDQLKSIIYDAITSYNNSSETDAKLFADEYISKAVSLLDALITNLEFDIRDEILSSAEYWITDSSFKQYEPADCSTWKPVTKCLKGFFDELKTKGFIVHKPKHYAGIGNNNRYLIEKSGVKNYVICNYGIFHGVIFRLEESSGFVYFQAGRVS